MDATGHHPRGEETAQPTEWRGGSSPADRYADLYDPHFPAPRPESGPDAASGEIAPTFYDPHFPTPRRP